MFLPDVAEIARHDLSSFLLEKSDKQNESIDFTSYKLDVDEIDSLLQKQLSEIADKIFLYVSTVCMLNCNNTHEALYMLNAFYSVHSEYFYDDSKQLSLSFNDNNSVFTFN